VVVVGHEADLHALGFVRDPQAALARQPADRVLGEVADREERAAELALAQGEEHVRLVLPRVPPLQERRPPAPPLDARVVARRDEVGAHGVREVHQLPELEVAVAGHAGIGRGAAVVLGDEVVDDAGEGLLEVEGIEGDLQEVRHPAGVVGVLDGAAALPARAGGGTRGLRPVPHEDSGHAVPGAAQEEGRDAGVDPPAHRQEHVGHAARLA
jgi:hypothetical protein